MNKTQHANDARCLIDEIGRGALAQAVGVKLTTVSAAYVKNKLPAAWYLVVCQLAKQKGKKVSDGWFSFKHPPPQ